MDRAASILPPAVAQIRRTAVPVRREILRDEPARVGMTNILPPPFLVLLGMLTTQLGAAVATGLFASLGPMGTVFWRLVFAALVLLAVTRPKIGRLRREDWSAVLVFGIAIGFMNLCFYQALARLPLGVAVSIEFCGPLAVAALAARSWREGLSAAIALFGLALLAPWQDIGKGLTGETVGFCFALGAALGWAGYVVLGARASRRVQGLEGLALAMLAGALLSAPIALPEGLPALASPELLLVALGVALLSSVLPYGLEYAAMRHMTSRTFSLILCAEPAIAALIGLVFLGDSLGPVTWAGMLLVSAASLGAALARNERPHV